MGQGRGVQHAGYISRGIIFPPLETRNRLPRQTTSFPRKDRSQIGAFNKSDSGPNQKLVHDPRPFIFSSMLNPAAARNTMAPAAKGNSAGELTPNNTDQNVTLLMMLRK